MGQVTVPDPHASAARAPLTRRALREAREGEHGVSATAAAITAAGTGTDSAAATIAPDVGGTGERVPATTVPLPTLTADMARPADVHRPADAAAPHPPIFKAPPPPLPPAPLVPLLNDESAPRHARKAKPLARLALVAASLVLAVATTSGALAVLNPASDRHTDQHATGSADITASTLGANAPDDASSRTSSTSTADVPTQIPTPPPAPVTAAVDLCDKPAFTAALTAHDDAAAIAAAGGGADFRQAVVGGQAPCVPMDDPTRLWIVVDKQRPLQPLQYAPTPRAVPDGVRSLDGAGLRTDAAAALTRMVAAARTAGAGQIAMNSGYRSYKTQHGNYYRQVEVRGTKDADLVSARPGFSEHQTGLATDVVACDPHCGTLDQLAATAQGRWIVAHAWQYGWIVRYEQGQTPETGYLPEPWHLRYIGVDLAEAYHDGGFHSLEQFMGLPAAPGY